MLLRCCSGLSRPFQSGQQLLKSTRLAETKGRPDPQSPKFASRCVGQCSAANHTGDVRIPFAKLPPGFYAADSWQFQGEQCHFQFRAMVLFVQNRVARWCRNDSKSFSLQSRRDSLTSEIIIFDVEHAGRISCLLIDEHQNWSPCSRDVRANGFRFKGALTMSTASGAISHVQNSTNRGSTGSSPDRQRGPAGDRCVLDIFGLYFGRQTSGRVTRRADPPRLEVDPRYGVYSSTNRYRLQHYRYNSNSMATRGTSRSLIQAGATDDSFGDTYRG